MSTYFAIIPAFPLLSFLLLALLGKKLPRMAAASIGVGLTAISAILTIVAGIEIYFH